MSDSFWESLGRGVAYGWKKAKDVGTELTDRASGQLDLREARDALQLYHRQLGEMAAEAHRTGNESFDLTPPTARELLQKIDEMRSRIAEIEQRIAERAEEEENEKSENEKEKNEEAKEKNEEGDGTTNEH